MQPRQLGPGELPERARALSRQPDATDLGSHQPDHRMADRGEQPPHDMLTALVQHDLDHGSVAVALDHPECVDLDVPAVERDPGAQPLPHVGADRCRYLGQIRLRYPEGRVGQPMS